MPEEAKETKKKKVVVAFDPKKELERRMAIIKANLDVEPKKLAMHFDEDIYEEQLNKKPIDPMVAYKLEEMDKLAEQHRLIMPLFTDFERQGRTKNETFAHIQHFAKDLVNKPLSPDTRIRF